MSVRVRRRIRSGSFGLPYQRVVPSNSGDFGNKILTVNRTYVPSTYDTNNQTVSIDFRLSYRIHNQDLLTSGKAPLILLHGGPSIPSNYLQSSAATLSKERSVITYDQIGCGSSSEPSDINAYSIDFAVNDLFAFVKHLQLKKFHILGHSFGGIIGFEFMKRLLSDVEALGETKCLSLSLVSTPFSVKDVDQESEIVLKCFENENISAQDASSLFQKSHVFRVTSGNDTLPAALREAYSKRGKVWQGTEVIQYYVANMAQKLHHEFPHILLLRGEHDFVSNTHAITEWSSLMTSHGCKTIQHATLPGCSHYSMLENEELFSCKLMSFLVQIENI